MYKIQLVDINIFASVTLLVILISLAFRKKNYSLSTRLFSLLILSNITLLLIETLSWLIDGINGESFKIIIFVINFIYILFCSIPAVAWLNYLDYQIYGSINRLRKRLFYLYSFLIVLILLIYSIKTGFIFYIDDKNSYNRGPGLFIIYGVSYLALLYSLVLTYHKKKSIEKRLMVVILSFTIIPAIGAMLQFIFYGTVIIWASMTIAVLVIYLVLEIQQETRDYLTGLYNRKQVDEWIHYRIHQFDKKGGFSLVMIDINDFKKINDNYGHDEGDNALILFSTIKSTAIPCKFPFSSKLNGG